METRHKESTRGFYTDPRLDDDKIRAYNIEEQNFKMNVEGADGNEEKLYIDAVEQLDNVTISANSYMREASCDQCMGGFRPKYT